MPKKLFRLCLTAVCGSLVLLSSGVAHAGYKSVSQQELKEAVAKVQAGGSPSMARTDAAEHVAELTRKINPQKVDDETLANMMSLLNIHDDSVRYWIARALGNLGPRANMTVPTLLKLLPEADCLNGAITSASAIRYALKKMGVKQPQLTKCAVPPIAG
jgi:hypothetical protein